MGGSGRTYQNVEVRVRKAVGDLELERPTCINFMDERTRAWMSAREAGRNNQIPAAGKVDRGSLW